MIKDFFFSICEKHTETFYLQVNFYPISAGEDPTQFHSGNESPAWTEEIRAVTTWRKMAPGVLIQS